MKLVMDGQAYHHVYRWFGWSAADRQICMHEHKNKPDYWISENLMDQF